MLKNCFNSRKIWDLQWHIFTPMCYACASHRENSIFIINYTKNSVFSVTRTGVAHGCKNMPLQIPNVLRIPRTNSRSHTWFRGGVTDSDSSNTNSGLSRRDCDGRNLTVHILFSHQSKLVTQQRCSQIWL